LKWRYEKSGVVKLSQLVINLDWLETVRVFMMLLFLAQRLEINLIQNEDDEILITLEESEG